MPIYNGQYNIIRAAADADFVNEIYYQVYASSAATPTVNGVAISMGASSILDIVVKSISATSGVFVIGDKRYSVDAPTTLSKYPEP